MLSAASILQAREKKGQTTDGVVPFGKNSATPPPRRPRFWGGALSGFSRGDRVRVSDDFFWAKGATGAISAPPDAVLSLSGPWDGGLTRQEKSALGMHTVYWVSFDEPQVDADGDGPYRGGQIWESALSLLTDRPN
jgi:hypothetical protein